MVRCQRRESARDVPYPQRFPRGKAPDKAEHIELVFEKGNCVAIGYHELDALLADLGITGAKA